MCKWLYAQVILFIVELQPVLPRIKILLIGNNTYNEGITQKLDTLSMEELAAYTLMEKIQSPSSENYIVGAGNIPELKHVVNELGIFGALVA